MLMSSTPEEQYLYDLANRYADHHKMILDFVDYSTGCISVSKGVTFNELQAWEQAEQKIKATEKALVELRAKVHKINSFGELAAFRREHLFPFRETLKLNPAWQLLLDQLNRIDSEASRRMGQLKREGKV
jgi:hypothetical protein